MMIVLAIVAVAAVELGLALLFAKFVGFGCAPDAPAEDQTHGDASLLERLP